MRPLSIDLRKRVIDAVEGRMTRMDNLPARKLLAVRQAIERAAVRTIDELWAAIADVIPAFVPTECAN